MEFRLVNTTSVGTTTPILTYPSEFFQHYTQMLPAYSFDRNVFFFPFYSMATRRDSSRTPTLIGKKCEENYYVY